MKQLKVVKVEAHDHYLLIINENIHIVFDEWDFHERHGLTISNGGMIAACVYEKKATRIKRLIEKASKP